MIVSRVQSNLQLQEIDELPEDFEICFNQTLKKYNQTQKASSQDIITMTIMCDYLLKTKSWQELDQILPLLISASAIP